MNSPNWPTPETLRHSLLKAWQEQPPQNHSTPLQIRFIPPPQTFTYSKIYEFELNSLAGRKERVVVKVPVAHKVANLKREYMALHLLTRHFQEKEDLTVPRPLCLLKQPAALVMAKVSGERLVRQVQSCRRIFKREGASLPDHVRRAGRWLAHLHRMESLTGSSPHPDALSRYQQAVAILQRSHAPASSLSALQLRLIPHIQQLPAANHVPLHGDYTLRNILSRDRQITVIDTTLSHTGPAEIDLASFIAALQYIDWGQIWFNTWLYENDCLEHLRFLFIESYQAVGGQLDFSTLDTLLTLQYLQRWAAFVSHVQHNYPPLSRRLIIFRLHRYFASFVFP